MGKTEDFSWRPHGVAMSSPLSHLQHGAERSNSVTGRRANAALARRQRDRESVGRGHGRAEATACADGTGARCRRHRPSVSSVSPEEGRLPTLPWKLPLPLLLATASRHLPAGGRGRGVSLPRLLLVSGRASYWRVLGKGQLRRARQRSLQTPPAVGRGEPEGRAG